MIKLKPFDPVDFLKNKESCRVYLDEAIQTGDVAFIAKSIGVIAKAKGISDIASKTGLSREQMYRSFSDKGNPTIKTFFAVIKALELKLNVQC